MHTGRLVISAVWEPEIDCSGFSNDSTLALDTARTDRQLFEFETRTRLSARCCSMQRTPTSATGSDTRSVLSVARALDRRPVCRVWPGVPASSIWRADSLIRRSPADLSVSSIVLDTAALKPTRPALRYVLLCWLAVGSVDGEPAVIIHFWDGGRWAPTSFIRFEIADDRIARIMDYIHCPWILTSATSVIPGELS